MSRLCQAKSRLCPAKIAVDILAGPVYNMGRNLNWRPNPDENFTEIFKLFIYFSAAVLQ
jgi:hypothetical protein